MSTASASRRAAGSRPAGSPATGTGQPSGQARAGSVRAGSLRALPPPGRRPVRVPELVLGILLVAGCAFGAVAWQRAATTTTTVVVASRHIARGSVIGIGDLRGAQVGGETSAMISGADARSLLGKVAVVDIEAAVPFTPTLLADAPPLGAQEALSSMALEPGEFPPDLAAGDVVRIVVTTTAGAGAATTAAVLEQTASVWGVDPAPDGRTSVITVRGTIDIGTAVAAADAVRLVRVEGS